MKYDLEASLLEVDRRKRKRLHKRARDKTIFTGGVTAVLAVMTALSYVFAVPHEAGSVGQSPYGAFLLDGNAGAYVLVGVIAFAFGAAFTMLCIRLAKLKKENADASAKASENNLPNTED